jgi:hypothetical protein
MRRRESLAAVRNAIDIQVVSFAWRFGLEVDLRRIVALRRATAEAMAQPKWSQANPP